MTQASGGDVPQTMTVWVGPNDHDLYHRLVENTGIDDTLSDRIKETMELGLIVENAIQARDDLQNVPTGRERKHWVRQAILDHGRE